MGRDNNNRIGEAKMIKMFKTRDDARHYYETAFCPECEMYLSDMPHRSQDNQIAVRTEIMHPVCGKMTEIAVVQHDDTAAAAGENFVTILKKKIKAEAMLA